MSDEKNMRDEKDQRDEERPHDAMGTARCLWQAAGKQRWRLVVAAVSAIVYVAASLGAAAYSAHVVDVLWEHIQQSFAAGEPYVVGLENGGREVLIYLGIWTCAWVFYSVQSLVMSSFAERLNLSLRKKISAKLGRLPLSYFDAHQPGDTISRATNDLDKVSEVLQRGLLQLIIAFTTLVGAVVLMLVSNLVLALVFCGFAAASVVVTRFAARLTLDAAAAHIRAFGEKYPLTIEMGRFFAAPCGTFLTGVADAKCNLGVNYAVCDGGMHQVKYDGQLMGMQVPPLTLLRESADAAGPWMLCGSLCTTADVLVREAQLPPLRVGDVIALGRCGAYSVTEGVSVFLSRDMPRVALYRDGAFTLVRDRFATDVLNTCQTLEDGT